METKPKETEYDMFNSDSSVASEESDRMQRFKDQTVVGKGASLYYSPNKGEVVFGKYRVLDMLGKGAYSSIIKVKNIESKQVHALKVIIDNEELMNEGKKEYAILKELEDKDPLNMKNIIRVFDELKETKYYGFGLVLMKTSLRSLIDSKSSVSLKEVRKLAFSMLTALLHCKRSKILHLDIKPDNILVSDKGDYVLTDFSSSFNISEVYKNTEYMPLFYRPPEIFLGYPPSYNSDIWSLACTLFELYTKRFLIKGDSNTEIVENIIKLSGPFSNKYIDKSPNGYQLFSDDYRLIKTNGFKNSFINQKMIQRTGVQEKIEEYKDIKISKGLKDFVDLLEKMLHYNHKKRISVEDALEHPFFKN